MKRYFSPYTFLLIVSGLFLLSTILIFGCGHQMVTEGFLRYIVRTDSDTSNAAFYGQKGDAFGGTLSPLIGWLAALLTFFAFYVQYEANIKQKSDLQIERFENKFYNMINILRQNTSEVTIGKTLLGRKAFVSMYIELKFLFLLITKFAKTQKALLKATTGKESIDEEILFNIAYLIFFFGIGQNSTAIILDLIDKKYDSFLKNLEAEIERCQGLWKKDKRISIEYVNHNGDSFFELNTTYKPFNGHMSRFSHYIRHIFQIVKFIDDYKGKNISHEDKYNYAATLRAQLSTHEQVLIYYNSLSVLGKPWRDNHYFEKYCIVKSLPLPLADFYKTPLSWLPVKNEHDKHLFEWSEIKTRLSTI